MSRASEQSVDCLYEKESWLGDSGVSVWWWEGGKKCKEKAVSKCARVGVVAGSAICPSHLAADGLLRKRSAEATVHI